MRTISETYGPDGRYAIVSRYIGDECVWMGYKTVYDIVDGLPVLNTEEPIEVRAEYKTNGLFLVSADGKLFSTKTKRLLTLTINKQGYLGHSTRLGGRAGKCVYVKVHRAVAIAFLGYNGHLVVNHKDCDKLNNHLSNLEWVTHLENTQHAAMNGLLDRPTDEYVSRLLTAEQVTLIRNDPRSSRKLVPIFGVSRKVTQGVRRGIKTTKIVNTKRYLSYNNM